MCLALAFRKPGSFSGLQLLSGEQLNASFGDILALLAKAFVDDAPLPDELGWLKSFPDQVRNQTTQLLNRRPPFVASLT